MVLEDTDYGAAIFENQNKDASTNDFEVGLLRRAMKEKLATELHMMAAQAVYPLNEFITRMMHGYQIDNVVFLIEGLKSGRNTAELMNAVDPLGYFKELKYVQPQEGDDYAYLYQNVLIDLPVGVYFRKFINEITDLSSNEDSISTRLQDYSLQQIQLRVRKVWLDELFDFCETQL